MRATLPALLAVGLLAAALGSGGASANEADLVEAMRLDLATHDTGDTREAGDTANRSNGQSPAGRVQLPTDLAVLKAGDVQLVDTRQAMSGKEPKYRCIKVSGVRSWRQVRRQLVRLGYRRLHVIRYVPRRIAPVAGGGNKATCTGGWFLVRARKGRVPYRVAMDAASLKVAARARR